jgi:hypothetical protein
MQFLKIIVAVGTEGQTAVKEEKSVLKATPVGYGF